MDSQQHIHRVLRVHLLALSKLSQQAVDNSIKGYEFRNPDFCRGVCDTEQRAAEHYRNIKDLSRQLIACGMAAPSDLLYPLTALEIAAAFHLAGTAAIQIAQDTLRLLESSPQTRCAALNRFGRLVNGAMRLCGVALFDENAEHARTVLQSRELTRVCVPAFDGLYGGIDQKILAEGALELAIARSLGEIGRQACEIADAILSWMTARSRAAASRTCVNDQIPPAFLIAQEEEAINAARLRSHMHS